MSATFVYLLPPSEGKAVGGRAGRGRDRFLEDLSDARQQVRDSLARLLEVGEEAELARVLGVRGALYQSAFDSMRDVVRGTPRSLPAWRRYRGVVWQHLDPASLSRTQRDRILVPSGLYGLNGANDLIADYRLKMNIRLDPLGFLSSFWRPHVTSLLRDLPRGVVVVNALPREHAAACDFAEIATRHRVIHLDFVTRDRARAAGHVAKAAKGTFVRFLLDVGLESATSWRWEGWRARETRTGLEIVAP